MCATADSCRTAAKGLPTATDNEDAEGEKEEGGRVELKSEGRQNKGGFCCDI